MGIVIRKRLNKPREENDEALILCGLLVVFYSFCFSIKNYRWMKALLADQGNGDLALIGPALSTHTGRARTIANQLRQVFVPAYSQGRGFKRLRLAMSAQAVQTLGLSGEKTPHAGVISEFRLRDPCCSFI